MWSRLEQFLGIIPDSPDFDEVIHALHGDVVKRNFLFHRLRDRQILMPIPFLTFPCYFSLILSSRSTCFPAVNGVY